jgi:hypothetical protein
MVEVECVELERKVGMAGMHYLRGVYLIKRVLVQVYVVIRIVLNDYSISWWNTWGKIRRSLLWLQKASAVELREKFKERQKRER